MDINKLKKRLPTGYAEDVEGYDADRLRGEIIQAETNIREVEQARTDDTKLAGAKEMVKEYSAPYRDGVKAQRDKISYVLHLLDEKGEL